MAADHLHRELADLGFYIRAVVKMKWPKSSDDMPLFLVVCSDTVENRKLYQLTRVADVPVRTEDLRSRRGPVHCFRCQEMNHVARHCSMPDRCVPRRTSVPPSAHREANMCTLWRCTAAATGASSALPTASAAPSPAASEAVPTPEAPAPPPQPLVAEPGTASPVASSGPPPANRRRGVRRPEGTQCSATSVEQPQVDSHSEAASPPPSSDGAPPAASTPDLANLVAQLTALVTSATKLIEVLSQQLTAAVPMAALAPTAVNTHQLHRGQR
ncbi:nematocyst expressed protein 3-like [Schistocerca nitens]|uniref:nematocyst expressed protein 3-like n=1 Tax=Schistocerca nitens TaxID=7011 RepID=UPI00211755B9|nr:nematocyst expressed protein 3-like [Schistocerca nitens]